MHRYTHGCTLTAHAEKKNHPKYAENETEVINLKNTWGFLDPNYHVWVKGNTIPSATRAISSKTAARLSQTEA
jgi:hypothetical protein